jgi:hypothetical protein
MESDWVQIMPYLEKPIPPIAVNSDYPGVTESKEVMEYFTQLNPKSPIDSFRDFYANLPSTPKIGQTKSEQVMEAIHLMKLADKVKSQLSELGIKR